MLENVLVDGEDTLHDEEEEEDLRSLVRSARSRARKLALQACAFKLRAEAAEATAAAQAARLAALHGQVRRLRDALRPRPEAKEGPVSSVMAELKAVLRGASPTPSLSRWSEPPEPSDDLAPPFHPAMDQLPRVRLVSEVQMRLERETWHGASVRLSSQCMIVASWAPPPVGAVVEVTLSIPGEQPIVAGARVTWHKANADRVVSGCALAFEGLDPVVRNRLTQLAGSLYTG